MPIVRLPGGQLRDEIREPVYDTIDIDSSSTLNATRRFFSDVQGKSRTLTNLRQNNLLETAVSFRVMGLALDVQNQYAANFNVIPLLMENSALRLQVGEKVYWEGPARFAGGRILSDVAHWDGTSGSEKSYLFQQYGNAAVSSIILEGKHVVDINPLQTFYVEWITDGLTATEIALATPTADTKARFVCSLKGLKRRPVQ